MPTRFEPLQHLEYLLALASHRMKGALTKELDRRDVSLESWRILTLLSNGKGWTMGELARAAMMSLATATRSVDTMVGEALVYRAPDAADGRKVLIFQSDKGRKLWSEIKETGKLCQTEVIEQYGTDWVEDLVSQLERFASRRPKSRRRSQ